MTHVVILGAGFGGLELTSRLVEDLPGEVEVTLIDKSDWFIFGYAKLDVMFGRTTFDAVKNHYSAIDKPGVTYKKETITSIDPNAKRVVTDKGTYDADILVVALGADLAPEATPGLLEAGYEYYSPEGANAARAVVNGFEQGTVIVGVLGPFFKCPPAPCETAFMLHDQFVERGVRENITIQVLSPLGIPVPVSPDTSKAILEEFDVRGIEYHGGTRVVTIDPATKTATAEGGETFSFDLFLGVPVHRAPEVVVQSGLTEPDGWIGVNPATFATKFAGVFAVGDVTSAPVPRAGVFAEGEARTVADVIVQQLRGGAEAEPYRGQAACYIEFGDERVGKVVVDFLSGPAIKGTFAAPSREIAKDKEQFGATRRARWFGT
jgi:sulfide:quinone oxidoreductase